MSQHISGISLTRVRSFAAAVAVMLSLHPLFAQTSKMGLMMRESAAADAPMIALLLTPKSTADIEVPNWHLVLMARDSIGADASVRASSQKLDAPIVTWGRLMAPVWMRLSRSGGTFTGSFSPDGRSWTLVGTVTFVMTKDLQAGLAGCSSIKVSTTMMFDNVSAPGWSGR